MRYHNTFPPISDGIGTGAAWGMSAHPLPQLLAAFAGAANVPQWDDRTRQAVADHLITCDQCRSALFALDRAFDAALEPLPFEDGLPDEQGAHSSVGVTPDDETLAAYAVALAMEGEESANARFPSIASHLANCAICREALAFMTDGLADDIAQAESYDAAPGEVGEGPDPANAANAANAAASAASEYPEAADGLDLDLRNVALDLAASDAAAAEATGLREAPTGQGQPLAPVGAWLLVFGATYRLADPFQIRVKPQSLSITHPLAQAQIVGELTLSSRLRLENAAATRGRKDSEEPPPPRDGESAEATVQRITLDLLASDAATERDALTGQQAPWVQVEIGLRAEVTQRISGQLIFTWREVDGASRPAPDVAWQILREATPIHEGVSNARGISRFFLREPGEVSFVTPGEFSLVAQVEGRKWIIPLSITNTIRPTSPGAHTPTITAAASPERPAESQPPDNQPSERPTTMSNTFHSAFHVGQRLTNFASVDLHVERVATGGFGQVALGIDQMDGQWQAIKALRPDLLMTLGVAGNAPNALAAQQAQQARLRASFLREALTWVGMWPHANLLTAQYVVEINGQLMLVLDYAEHGSLRDLFHTAQRQDGWLRPTTSLHLAQQIAAGLVELHTPRPDLLRDDPIVHRDLKPENILLSHGRAMITDFGLAKAVQEVTTPQLRASEPSGPLATRGGRDAPLASATFTDLSAAEATASAPPPETQGTATQAYRTQRGVALGTPAYMAPEQWLDAAMAETPADAYAYGVLLVELFTSQHPLLPLAHPHSLGAWRLAHLTATPRTLAALGLEAMWQQEAQADGRSWTPVEAQAAGQATAALDQLCDDLLAKAPAARPSLGEALTRLQAVAQVVGEDPYIPQDAYPPTPEHQMIFWKGWADTYDRFGLQGEALPRIERARAVAPDDPSVLSSQANILAGLGRREEAVTLYRQALADTSATDPQGRTIRLNQLANRLQDLRRYAEAESAYAEALTLQPGNAGAWYNRANNERSWAQAEAQAGRWAEARAHAEQGLVYAEHSRSLDPDNPRRVQQIEALRQLCDLLRGE